MPGLAALRAYQARWFVKDLTAGVVLATMLAPVGIAYAEASGLPGICGLYASIAPLLAYAVFGPSRIMVLGPDSSLAAVILGVVLPLSAGEPQRAVALAGAMAIVSGIVCIVAGVARLGFVTELLSKPIRHGYMNGIALTVLVSQLPEAVRVFDPGRWTRQEPVGHRRGGSGRKNELDGVRSGRRRADGNPAVQEEAACARRAGRCRRRDRDRRSIRLGAARPCIRPWPTPVGLPRFAIPWITPADVVPVLIGGLAVALVSFADTSVLSRAYAVRTGSKVDPNQEIVGLGAANLAAGLFQGFPISSSSSRTPVAEAAGAKSQLTGVVGAVCVALLLVAAPNLLQHLPTAALAAVVIASAVGLVEITDLVRLFRIERWEFWLSIVCFVGVAVFGAIPGIGLAIAIAVAEFLWAGWRPHSAVLGRTEDIEGFHDIERHPNASQIPGLLLFRWDAPLFFANAELFKERVLDAVALSAVQVRWVVVSAAPVTRVDVTAGDALAQLEETLRSADARLCFAELKDPVKDTLKRFGLFATIGEDAFFPTIGAAVDVYLRDNPVGSAEP